LYEEEVFVCNAETFDPVQIDVQLKEKIEWLVIDANFSAKCIEEVLVYCRQNGIRSWFESTSATKVLKVSW
jgi:hypothetical protein